MPKFNHVVRNCIEWDASKFIPSGCVSYKEDGVRAFYYPGESNLWSRDEKPIRGMDHIVEDLKDMEYPIDMELIVPGLEFNKASGVIRNHDNTPQVQARIIDVVSPGLIQDRLNRRPALTLNISSIDHFKVRTIEGVEAAYAAALKRDYEGVVWKSLRHEYLNKRNWHWMRMVPIASEDCECLGVYEGNGKMAGIAGGIFIDFMGLKCKCGTMKGMTYEDRWELLDNAESYIGVKAEIQYKNLQPSGKPRQPRFKGWRWDK